MDPLLAQRYKALYARYGAGSSSAVTSTVKRYLTAHTKTYREDALYFLLVNFDHMVIRPLSGYIPNNYTEYGDAIAESLDPILLDAKIKESFEVIKENLDKSALPASADEVLRAIYAGRDRLDKILWWRPE